MVSNLVKERFEKYINKTKQCWVWKASKTWHGYGRFWFNRKHISAHRMSWFLYKGKIPKRLFVCHKCDNPPCVNPAHLWIGTAQDNVIDKFKKGRHIVENRQGNKSHNKKLTEQKVKEIRQLYYLGHYTQEKLANVYKVSNSPISKVILNQTWFYE